MSKKSKIASFLGGALVGVGLGFLFAPKSGSETRKELSNKMSDLWDKNSLENKLREIESELKNLDKEKVLSIAKEKLSILKNKMNELVEMAKEAGKPVIENAANAAKKELANVTREVLKKLESK